MNQNLKKNIYLDYIFRFLSNFNICDAIWVLYLGYKGLSLWQIGVIEGIFHATSLLSEVPSGALADLLGRKRVLIVSRIFGLISSFIMLSADRFWMFGVGFVFAAWSYNLLSGSEEALLYDSFLAMGEEKKYFKTNGRLNFIVEVSQGISVFAGGMLSEYSFVLCYLVGMFLETFSLFICFFMKEPERAQTQTEEKISVRGHFATTYRLLKGNREVLHILFFYSVLFAFYTSIFFYSQQFYYERGLSRTFISLILLGMGLCGCAGALFSERLSILFGKRACYISGIFIAVGLSAIACPILPVSVCGFGLSSFFNSMLYPLQSEELNRRIPSEQRATIISVSSMFFSVVMILLFPFIGFLGDVAGLYSVIWMIGVLLLIFTVVYAKVRKKVF